MSELPFQAEYAKSGRSSCKGCKEKIDQGALRIAVMVQNSFHDGKLPNWHHEECFFKSQNVQSITDIENFNRLKLDDKERIKTAIELNTKGMKKRSASGNSAVKDFSVEYSKSNVLTCRHCDIKIVKDEIRICKILFDTKPGDKTVKTSRVWHHVKCFAKERDNLGFLAGGDALPGFNKLSKKDKAMVKEEIPPKSLDEVPVKKMKTEPKDEEDKKDLEKKLEKQNKLFHKRRSVLSQYRQKDIQELLEANSQVVPPGINECLDRLADCMAFGVPAPCPECKGQLVLGTFNYKCTGDLSEWSKCQYTTVEPMKVPMKIPESFRSFKNYKPRVVVRLFDAAPPPSPVKIVKKNIPIPPLKNLQFFIYAKTKTTKEELRRRILKLGGLVVSKLTDTTAAVISNAATIENMPREMVEVKEKDIEVVDESFLDLIDADTGTVAKTLELIKLNNFVSWGSDPAKRVPQDVIDGKSIPLSGNFYAKLTTTTKFKIKGGTTIDPDSGLENVAHVYTDEDGTKYTVVLCKTDIGAQKNSYYKLQVLEGDVHQAYWLFKSWGRIGTSIGGKKLDTCNSLEDAIMSFKDVYKTKTENPWESRDKFMKAPGAYYPIEVDYDEDETDGKSQLHVEEECKLPEPVQHLVNIIFDINIMMQTLKEFELDTEKMPLGKLSKKQIKSGYEVLSELLSLIENGAANQNKIIDATNRFYTMVPHDFGVNNPPPLDNVEVIKKKSEMLDNLLEIEIAYSLLSSESDEKTNQIEAHYIKLKTDIAPLPRESPEFHMILEYVANTHAATHSDYKLEVLQIFTAVREGEDERYKPFRKLHNRRLLWHGSRTTNFAGILSQGLRIAPPEAPISGYMFGKGIYFADMVSKSANYCFNKDSGSPVGLMMLCEVALGNMKQCHISDKITKLPSGTHSTWGVGRMRPDEAMNRVIDDGTIVPLGKPVTHNTQTSLLYNEFIVYDAAQVNVKYLLEMKFHYN